MMSLSTDFFSHIEKHHLNCKHIYTGGSKTEVGVGYAAVLDDSFILGTLPIRASIFTAELKAIEQLLQYVYLILRPT